MLPQSFGHHSSNTYEIWMTDVSNVVSSKRKTIYCWRQLLFFLCIIYLIHLIFVWRCRYQKSGENSRKINVYWDYLHYMMLNWNYKYIVSYKMSNLKEHIIYIYIYIYNLTHMSTLFSLNFDSSSSSSIYWPCELSDKYLYNLYIYKKN